jgi:hypothetical protein
MKHSPIANLSPWTHPKQGLPRPIAAVLFGILLLGPSAALAAECPPSSPEDPQERRRLAKEWFSGAEQAENSGNDTEAVRAYACSYKMVAHPFTAFNLGRVAERTGDNELALKMFKAYLTLKPDAADGEDVRARIQSIEAKIAAASAPAAISETSPEAATPSSTETPADSVSPPPETSPAPPEVARRPEPEPQPQGPRSRVLEWTIGGAAGVALVVGVGLNLAARTKMSNCQNDATVRDAQGNLIRLGTANDECNAAKPLAYWSYAMFTVAAAAAATDALLLLLRRGGSSSSSDEETSVGFSPLPGGGALTARGRF